MTCDALFFEYDNHIIIVTACNHKNEYNSSTANHPSAHKAASMTPATTISQIKLLQRLITSS